MEDLKNESNKQFNIILAVSALAFAFLVWLIYFKAPTQVNDQGAIVMVMLLPKINAFLNGLCTIALIVGYIFIKNGNKSAHIKSMMMAFVFSSLFLIGYILYHTFHGVHR
ncbi:MAG: putative membrane protein, partial [Thermoproteota archaeon]